jgi:hypothetical protein
MDKEKEKLEHVEQQLKSVNEEIQKSDAIPSNIKKYVSIATKILSLALITSVLGITIYMSAQ